MEVGGREGRQETLEWKQSSKAPLSHPLGLGRQVVAGSTTLVSL